jgi:hypothetical protein
MSQEILFSPDDLVNKEFEFFSLENRPYSSGRVVYPLKLGGCQTNVPFLLNVFADQVPNSPMFFVGWRE